MTTTKLTVPILLNWSEIEAYMAQHDIVKVAHGHLLRPERTAQMPASICIQESSRLFRQKSPQSSTQASALNCRKAHAEFSFQKAG